MKRRSAPKNIIHAVTARYMRQNKGRTLTTFLGIVFTVLLMTCVFVGRESAIAYLEDVATLKNGQWHYSLTDVDTQARREVETLPFVRSTSATLSLGLTEFSASANPERPYLNVKAYEADAMTWNNLRIAEGRMPENGGEIVLSQAVREDGSDIQIGDTLDAVFFQRSITGTQTDGTIATYFPTFSLEVHPGETKDLDLTFPYYAPNDSFRIDQLWTGSSGHYTVVGFLEPPSFEPRSAAGYTAVTLAEQTLLAQTGEMNLLLHLDLKHSPSDAPELLAQIAGDGNVKGNNYLLAFSANSSDQTMNLMVNLMTGFFLLLILAVSMVLIYNVFNISFRERSRYLGMLSSVGATARQKRSSVYYEARVLLLAALPVGILAGFGVVLGGLRLMEPYVVQLVYGGIESEATHPHLILSWQALVCVIVASVVTVLLSAFLPARKIGKIGPIASIQGTKENRVRAKTKARGSAEGMVAHGFLHRQRRSQRSLLLAVTAFLLVLVVASFGVSRVIDIIEYKVGDSVTLDVKVQERECILYYNQSDEPAQEHYEALKQELQGRPEVASAEEWYMSMFALDVDTHFFSDEYWNAYLDIAEAYLGDEMSREELRKQYVQERYCSVGLYVPDDDTLRAIAAACGVDPAPLFDGDSVILINEAQMDSDHNGFEMRERPQRYLYYDIEQVSSYGPGDTFPVSVYNPELEQDFPAQLTVAGYASNEQLSQFLAVNDQTVWLLASRQTVEALIRPAGYDRLSDFLEAELRIRLAPGQEDFVDYLRQVTDGDDNAMALHAWNDPDYTGTLSDSLCGILRILLLAFVALSSVVCLLNLWNAIHGRMLERQRDFAVLRSVGTTQRQLQTMLTLECLGILGRGLVLAAVLSGVLIALIQHTLSGIFGHLSFHLPWGMFLFALVFTTAAVLLITRHSFRQEKVQNLIECIRKDSV